MRLLERADIKHRGAVCPDCQGYGDDGDAPCQTCGGTRVAPAADPVAARPASSPRPAGRGEDE